MPVPESLSAKRIASSMRRSDDPAVRRLASRVALLSVIVLLALLAGCTTATHLQVVDADEMSGRSVLMLEAPRVEPLPAGLQQHTQESVRELLAHSPYVGRFVTQREALTSGNLSPQLRQALERFGDTFVETGVADPEYARQVGEALGVELYSSAQLLFLACPPCEEGSRLWLVGQVAEADGGRVVMRAHLRTGVDDTPVGLEEPADSLLQDYLHILDGLFRPKWHKLRFRNLQRPTG